MISDLSTLTLVTRVFKCVKFSSLKVQKMIVAGEGAAAAGRRGALKTSHT
jgi:hypothetical protein